MFKQGSDFAVPSPETRICTAAARKLNAHLVKYQNRGRRFNMFKSKRKPIDTFDVTDGQLLPSGDRTSEPASETPSFLVLITLLELFCFKEEKDPRAANKVFENITKLLLANNMIPAWILNPDYAATRENILEYMKQLFMRQPKSLSFINNQPRYTADFKEIGQLGQGGCGSVYEALNKLDGRHYAIKKIRIDTFPDSVEKILKEAKTFAALDNPYIVRYHSAWIESCNSENCSPPDSNLMSMYASASKIKEISDSAASASKIKEISNSSDSYIVFERSNNEVDAESRSVSARSSSSNRSSSSTVSVENLQEVNYAPSNEVSTFVQNASADLNKCVAKFNEFPVLADTSWSSNFDDVNVSETLFIQMELCKETLKDWLEARNALSESSKDIVNDAKNRTIFQGMLQGVLCIHAQGIIHRDLKPDNIFLKDKTHAKIGDFGLATSRNQTEYKMNVPECGLALHSKGVGTKTYSAPEQQTGCNYDTTSDIYSLGLILYEMYHPCKTFMEKAELFEDLKKSRQISPFVLENFPQKAEQLLAMTHPDPTKRPTAKELLHQMQPPSKDEIIRDYEKEVATLKAEIECLNLKLSQKRDS